MAEVCVRVAVRIRPLLPKEVLHSRQVCVRVVPGSSQVMLGSDRLFSFDHAFGPGSSQDEVYEACVRPLVESLVEGHNATVFCYGQTGSGKTYTLEGGSLAEEGGIIDRVAHEVFSLLDDKTKSGEAVEATVRVSYMELYREELRDLLELQTVHKELHIREDERGNTVVVGAKEVVVSSAEELFSVLETGNALRHTGTTGMNDKSSRSHAILTLQLQQCFHHNTSSLKSVRSSKLCLVDLAGSERARKTGNTGTRLKESAHINTGLLALGNVIRALSDPGRNRSSAHIPYRDAKITRLLRDSLGGTAHTLMVACVSPSHHSVAETVSVLQFAFKARHIRNRPGAPSTHTEVRSCPMTWDPGEARVGELEFEVQTLRQLLKEKERDLQKEQDKKRAGHEEDSFSQKGLFDSKVTQEELSEYCHLAQDAAVLLENISTFIPDDSFRQRLEQWQERLRVVNKSCQNVDENCSEKKGDQQIHADILKLGQELMECKEALAIDEQILQQKDAELRQLQQKVDELNQECTKHIQALEEERERNHIKTEQLVNQQILIDRLRSDTLKSAATGTTETNGSGSSERRPHSVPLPRQSCAHRPVRKIHSSPPVYSLERVMAAFKMRGQLLLAEIEEKDEVYCPFIKQQNEKQDQSQEAEDEEAFLRKMGFSRSLNRTWTNQQKKHFQSEKSKGLDQASDGIEVIHLHQETNEYQQDQQTKPRHWNKLRSSATQRRIQELSVNMRMKEELLKDLEKTDKLSQAAERHGRHSADGREAGVLVRISLQSQQVRAELYRSLQHMTQQRAALQAAHRLEREESNNTRPEQHEVQYSGNKRKDDQREQVNENDWLEEEEEQLLQRRAELKELEEELRRREEVLERREACLQQKNKLEIKKLRSSHVLSQDLLRVSFRLESLDEQIQSGSSERRVKGVSVEELETERDALQKKREALEAQLKDNRVLTEEEEHCLLELEEALETLETALEFKNRSIRDRQEKLSVTELMSHESPKTEATHLRNVMSKVKELSPPEVSELFVKYFNKVVCLREAERSLRWRCEELELQTGEQEMALKEMEAAMQRLALDTDRRLTQQHRQHQSNIQLLLNKIKEIASEGEQQVVQERLQHLEKELFFYKSSSRQLKKKLRELSVSQHSVNLALNAQGDKLTEICANRPQTTPNEKTHIATTYTRIHATTIDRKSYNSEAEHSKTGRFSQQKPSPCSSSDHQANKKSTPASYNRTSQSFRQSNESSERGDNLQMTPVRLCRRDLRQISPSRLQVSGSTTRRQRSSVDTSTDTILEDSIEMSRNTDR